MTDSGVGEGADEAGKEAVPIAEADVEEVVSIGTPPDVARARGDGDGDGDGQGAELIA